MIQFSRRDAKAPRVYLLGAAGRGCEVEGFNCGGDELVAGVGGEDEGALVGGAYKDQRFVCDVGAEAPELFAPEPAPASEEPANAARTDSAAEAVAADGLDGQDLLGGYENAFSVAPDNAYAILVDAAGFGGVSGHGVKETRNDHDDGYERYGRSQRQGFAHPGCRESQDERDGHRGQKYGGQETNPEKR